jgi:hypothetical protein
MRTLVLALLAAALPAVAADKPAAFAPVTIPLTVMEGDLFNRDCRVFGVPVECAGVKTTFTWACGGETIVSDAFAQRARLVVKDDPELAPYRDAAGNAIFDGSATAELVIAGRSIATKVWVLRDRETNKQPTGIIGYAAAKQFQWEIDPRVPQITLRAPKSPLKAKPIATIPLKDEKQNLWVNIKIRNVAVDMCLIPQSTDLQAASDLQKKWDLEHKGLKVETNTYLGNVRTTKLTGKSGAFLSPDIYETDILVILLEENPNARSGIGQSLLNRFVYCIDAEKKEMNILAGIPLKEAQATTQPAIKK